MEASAPIKAPAGFHGNPTEETDNNNSNKSKANLFAFEFPFARFELEPTNSRLAGEFTKINDATNVRIVEHDATSLGREPNSFLCYD